MVFRSGISIVSLIYVSTVIGCKATSSNQPIRSYTHTFSSDSSGLAEDDEEIIIVVVYAEQVSPTPKNSEQGRHVVLLPPVECPVRVRRGDSAEVIAAKIETVWNCKQRLGTIERPPRRMPSGRPMMNRLLFHPPPGKDLSLLKVCFPNRKDEQGDRLCIEVGFKPCEIAPGLALRQTISCGHKDAGSCFVAHDTPCCNKLDCCQAVCAQKGLEYCCEGKWSLGCALTALFTSECYGSPAQDEACSASDAP